jgi:tyrosine-protein kinase Etk/Wzc
VRHGKTPKRILQLVDENMIVRPLNNISIVFNGVKERGFAKNEDGYGYGQGYGYGYGYVNSKQ